jgi:ribosome-associated protein
MVIATGTSERHIKALCNYVALTLKDKGVVPRGTEGAQGSEWVLMDLGIHFMHRAIILLQNIFRIHALFSKALLRCHCRHFHWHSRNSC